MKGFRKSCLVLILQFSPSSTFVISPSIQKYKTPSIQSTLYATTEFGKDTASTFPPFANEDEYLKYITEASALPQGFSTGSAVGKFIPEEAPSMGYLPIKATIIHLTDGPTDNWAATFTQNKVCALFEIKYSSLLFLIESFSLKKSQNEHSFLEHLF
jgi:hypothetical protein